MKTTKYKLQDIVIGKEGLLKGPFGSDLKKSLYVEKSSNTYKVYLQENILKQDISKGEHHITEEYFNKKMTRYLVSEGDFIVTCDGTLGEIFQLTNIKERGIISSSLLRITLNKKLVNEDFFPYFWESRIKYPLIRSHDNSVLKHLPGVNAIREFEIDLPEIDTQTKIANILCSIDSKIELNNKINKELEAMAKTLYDYWFVQFDFPDVNGKPYKSSGGKIVYDKELKREIPEGWEVENLEEICEIYQPQTISEKEMIKDGKYYVFGANGIVGMYDKYNHEDSEVTVTCRGNSCGTLNRTLPYSWITGNAMVIKFKDDKIHNEYLMHFLSWTKMDNVITGSAQPQITRTNLAPLKFLIPEAKILDNFSQKMEFNINLQLKNIEQNQELSKLRDWLLPMLMNGQVKVK